MFAAVTDNSLTTLTQKRSFVSLAPFNTTSPQSNEQKKRAGSRYMQSISDRHVFGGAQGRAKIRAGIIQAGDVIETANRPEREFV
jgi:hypothetical protein